jgi:hypothetical protein
MTVTKLFVFVSLLTLSVFAGTQEKNACPMHEQHMRESAQSAMHAPSSTTFADDKFAAMKERGKHTMGFDQDATTHHFLIRPDGGAIQVVANRSDDDESVNAIRHHLSQIRDQFAAGNFEAPFETHAEAPPGVTEMKAHAAAIDYAYQQLPAGAEVLIFTKDPAALQAVRSFLEYQIREHRTGDPIDQK